MHGSTNITFYFSLFFTFFIQNHHALEVMIDLTFSHYTLLFTYFPCFNILISEPKVSFKAADQASFSMLLFAHALEYS